MTRQDGAISVFDKDLFGTSKVERAVETLRFFCEGKRVLCAFSGGKDSQTCYHLLKSAGIQFLAQYSITRFEPPELIRFIREEYPDVVFRRAYRRSLVEDIRRHGLPCMFARWCCEAKHKATPGFDIAVIGVRWEESVKRKRTWKSFGFKPDKTAYVCPIIDWAEADVWEYLNTIGAKHCQLYDEGFKRIGCVCCPLARSQMAAQAMRWPKTAAVLKLGARLYVENLLNDSYVPKHKDSFLLSANTVEEYWTRWINSGQTAKPISDSLEIEEEECLFAGTGIAKEDGQE